MSWVFLLAGPALAADGPPPPPPGVEAPALVVTVTGVRSAKGKILACLSSEPAAFPDCKGHPTARHMSVAAQKGEVTLDFGPVPPGTYAVSLFHDENANGKLDTVMMIPREGYGFSRDAPVRMAPPRFAAAAFAIGSEPVRQTLKMRYLF